MLLATISSIVFTNIKLIANKKKYRKIKDKL